MLLRRISQLNKRAFHISGILYNKKDDSNEPQEISAYDDGDVGTDSEGDDIDKDVKPEKQKNRNILEIAINERTLKIEHKDAFAQKKWDGTVPNTFLEIGNDWEERHDEFDKEEAKAKDEVEKKGENWTEEHEMMDDNFDDQWMINELPEYNEDVVELRDGAQKAFGPGFQDESVFGTGIVDNKTSVRAMKEIFKERKVINPMLAFTKGQLASQIEQDIEAHFTMDYPTEFIDKSDDINDNSRLRSIHRALANQQIKEVVNKARQRKLDLEKGLRGYIIDVKNVTKVITTGKEDSTIVLFLIGNGQGAAGFGFGKGTDVEIAMERAKINAERDMIAIDRYEQRTIYHPLHGKHNGSQCMIRPARRGTGVKTGDLLYFVCECFGVEDVVGKMIGGRNPYSQIQAIFAAFSKHSGYEESAWSRGRRVRDLGFYGFKHYDDKDYGGMMKKADKI